MLPKTGLLPYAPSRHQPAKIKGTRSGQILTFSHALVGISGMKERLVQVTDIACRCFS
jgi:hypothetical protein